MRSWILFVAACCSLLASASVRADNAADAWVKPAGLLQAATVTVRVWNDAAEPAEGQDQQIPKNGSDGDRLEAADGATPAVTVCTGVCIGNGQIITSVVAGSDSRIRITLPGGAQTTARLRLIDEYSGLTLLETDERRLATVDLAKETPAAGSGVLTAAAWGAEKPVVSLGIVAGVDRLLRGAAFPPLIQCDVRTTDTSSGAGLVNRDGQLLGIVVAVDSPESRRGWSYAVPVAHVQRLLRMASRTDSEKATDQNVIIMKRQRPVVGMVLEGDEDAILVHRLTPGGPAEKAGLKIGDRVLSTDGVNIRSVYQAVLPTLHKQPGDTMQFRVQRDDGVHAVEVVLGGGLELPSAPRKQLSRFIQPQLQIGKNARGDYVTRSRARHLTEVSAADLPTKADQPPVDSSAEKLALLEKALDRYRSVIEFQQQQLSDQKEQRALLDARLAELRRELELLKQQTADPPAAK